MEYRRFPMYCDCGGEPKQIIAVGFSANHELVVHWRCGRCRRRVCTVKALSKCWSDTFAAPSREGRAVDTVDDRRFLHSIGVKYADE